MSTHGLGEVALAELIVASEKVSHLRKIIIQGHQLRQLIRDPEERALYCEEKEALGVRKGPLKNYRVMDAELMGETDDPIFDDEIPREYRDFTDPVLWKDEEDEDQSQQ